MANTGFDESLITKQILEEYMKQEGLTTGNEEESAPQSLPDFEEVGEKKEPVRMPFTSIFKGKGYLTKKGWPDFDISSIHHQVEDWDEEDRPFIPEWDEDYIWQYDVLYPVILGLVHNNKMLVHGPTGSGKTTMFKNIAAKLNWPYLRIGGRADMESDTILGKPWVENGTMTYQLGEVPKGYKKGYLIALDEIWKMPSGINMTFQRPFERDGILQLDDMPGTLADKQIHPDPRTRLVLADNVVGTGDGQDQYAATMIQDTSILNRMDMVLYLGYLAPASETSMLIKKFPWLPKRNAQKVVKLTNLVRKSNMQGELSVTMSPRNLISWMEKAIEIKDYKEAFRWAMMGRFAEDSEKAAVRGMWETVWGEKL